MESKKTARVSEEDVDASSQVSEGGGTSPFPLIIYFLFTKFFLDIHS